MLRLLYNFPRHHKFVLACSGGVDSMCAADFLGRGNKNFILAYFDHGTGNVDGALPVIKKFADSNKIELQVGKIQSEKPKKLSPEEHWRNERYRWLISLERPIVTCHHLDDAIEGYLFGALHGNPKLINQQTIFSSYGNNQIVYRPFLLNTKQQLIDWCVSHKVDWYEDVSNTNTKFPRNRIRHKILPEALEINPGLRTVIRKKLLEESEKYCNPFKGN